MMIYDILRTVAKDLINTDINAEKQINWIGFLIYAPPS